MALQSAAYVEMGGETRASVSDELELAVETHIKDFQQRHGPLPVLGEVKKKGSEQTELVVGPSERAYVQKLAEANRVDLLADLAQP